jgi:hypothetical protein
MIIDCSTCAVRDLACHDCVVTVLLGPVDQEPADLGVEERAAIAVLAGSGLVPPLRLLPMAEATEGPSTGTDRRPPAGTHGDDPPRAFGVGV